MIGEHDALHAVRAAAETQAAMGVLNERLERHWGVQLVNGTGIATGEVVVGAATADEHILIGDVVQLANRLEQSAPPMEVLIGEPMYRMVADRVTVDAVEPVLPKGAGVPVAADRRSRSTPRQTTSPWPPRQGRTRTRELPRLRRPQPPRLRRCGSCGAQLVAKRARETRKTVTLVFSDLRATTVGGEPLAPNVLKDVMARAFEAARRALARHGGTVEKFIGDAVMAVFGLPVGHEDDALRAVRSALE